MKTKTLAVFTIDKLGELRAQISDLQAQAKDLETEIKNQGDGAYEGVLFRAVVSEVNGTRVDWKTVAAKLEPSRQLVTANTKPTHSVRLTVSSRLKVAA